MFGRYLTQMAPAPTLPADLEVRQFLTAGDQGHFLLTCLVDFLSCICESGGTAEKARSVLAWRVLTKACPSRHGWVDCVICLRGAKARPTQDVATGAQSVE
eukprot:6186652-Amphidinium_carterae.1